MSGSPGSPDCTVSSPFYTPDENPDYRPEDDPEDDSKVFTAFDASFHKLFEHDDDGLLTASGKQDYLCYLKAMELLKTDPTNNAGVTALVNGLRIRQPYSSDPALPHTAICTEGNDPTDDVEVGGNRVLINPRSGASQIALRDGSGGYIRASEFFTAPRQIIGGPPGAGQPADKREFFEKYLSYRSKRTAAEMIEVYGMTMLRDVPLGEYHERSVVIEILTRTLNEVYGSHFVWGFDEGGNEITAATHPVTAANLFRGPGELISDAERTFVSPNGRTVVRPREYLSIFVRGIRPPLFPSGCAPSVASLIGASQFSSVGDRLLTLGVADAYRDPLLLDFVKTRRHYACLQNAEIPRQYPDGYFATDYRVVLDHNATGRHLGDYVHVDNVYEEYIRACDILTANLVSRDPGSPYIPDTEGQDPQYLYEGDGPALGPPDAWAQLGTVRGIAERIAFAEKWLYARRARPEVMANLIDLMHNHGRTFPLDPSLEPGGAAEEFLRFYQDWASRRGIDGMLLPQMYPEGSPAHPAWPSGHATVAGACVTVIKAMFNADSDQFRPVRGGPNIDINFELDKLASNIALGRNFGGVHFRADGEHGILLGEAIALKYLAQIHSDYLESPLKWSVQLRNGRLIDVPQVGPAPSGFAAELLQLRSAPPAPRSFGPGRYGKSNL